jgi:RNA polymerase sigma-70 factor, ECF subfamily
VNDDREVWKQISQGNVAAFDMLYRENAPRLCGFLRQITGDMTAEDIVQETFAHVWKKPVGFKPESGSLRGWLFGICRKRAAEWWRKRTPVAPEPEEQASVGNPELTSIIGDAMVRLPQEQRLLLWLREVEGQSYQELAAILEIPVGTVRSRLFAAREALRKIWYGNQKKGVSHDMR